MTPDAFLETYEAALVSHDWEKVAPLVHDDVAVTFSNGTHRGKGEVEAAYRRNCTFIREETYTIRNVHWVSQDDVHAVCQYTFAWSGLVSGGPAEGGGRGTSVLKKEGDRWLLVTEHLGPNPA